MSESMWWLDEAWWEKKILPLGFITLSFRELATVSLSFVAAFLASLPFEFPIAGVSFGGRATVFCLIFGTGCTVSSRRVKLLPVEVQVLSLLRIQGIAKARAILQNFPRSRKKKQLSAPESNQPPIMQEMVVEDFKNPIPLVIFGRVKEDIQNGVRVLLFLDDQVRVEDLIAPQKPRYRLSYVPLPQDVGTHALTVKLEGSSKPLVSLCVSIKGESSETRAPPTMKGEQ
ncbi:MAG: hypothetical protein E6K96_09480 [Thaumarchaeota archaeon]|nr:MAG: hypothetical protein E6K96_09480 [Nitrososphaerota archaeon]